MRIEPTNPFRIAPLDVPALRPVQAAPRIDAAPGPRRNPRLAGVVAAVVPGKVDFSGQRPQPSGPAIQMYRHPADKNAAATSISAGRTLDVTA